MGQIYCGERGGGTQSFSTQGVTGTAYKIGAPMIYAGTGSEFSVPCPLNSLVKIEVGVRSGASYWEPYFYVLTGMTFVTTSAGIEGKLAYDIEDSSYRTAASYSFDGERLTLTGLDVYNQTAICTIYPILE